MKADLEFPDGLAERAKARAALRGERLKGFVIAALQAYLEREAPIVLAGGWQSVFGQARREEVESVDAILAKEFEGG
jgi:hypothetical protein